MDGIVVGIGTALCDDPRLTARPPGPRQAVRIVLDSAARLPGDSQLVRTVGERPVWVAVTERAPAARRLALAEAGCEILCFPGEGPVPIVLLLEELGQRGLTNLLVEGGGLTLGAFLDAGQVDAVDLFLAPVIEGGSHAHTPARGQGAAAMANALRLEHHEVSVIDGDVRLQGTFRRPWQDLSPA
jgi:diaminohydroxyphosphoribosylaminopyrimidine deaminase/5-amino-6-(5-phosphoribosylamino)uracil reductase